MKKLLLALILMLGIFCPAQAQVGLFIRTDSSTLTSPVTGNTWLFNSSLNTVSVWNGSSFQIVSVPTGNFIATTAPTSANDNTQGYSDSSQWFDTTNSTYYVCVSAATSAAVWIQINSTTSIPLTYLQAGGATTGQSLIYNGTNWAPGSPNILLSQILQSGALTGQIPTWNGVNWVPTTANGTGTVTSVALAGDGVLYNTGGASGSPITAAGTLNLASSLKNQTPFTIVAGPMFGLFSATATVRALTQRDLPEVSFQPIVSPTGELPTLPAPYTYSDSTITEYSTTSAPNDICVGPDNNMYVCCSAAHTIKQVSTAGSVLNTYTVPSSGTPTAICYGGDGNLYFTDSANSKIGQMTTAGTFTMTATTTSSSSLTGICCDSSGTIWFCDPINGKYGKLTVPGLVVSEYVANFGTAPFKCCSGTNGQVFMTDNATLSDPFGPQLIIVNTSNGGAAYTGMASGATSPYGICTGINNKIWITDKSANKIYAYDIAAATYKTYTVPTGSSQPGTCCAGPDGKVHFIEMAGNKLASITMAGVFTETSLVTGTAGGEGCCVGGDGGIWTTENTVDNVAAQKLTQNHR